VRVSVVIVNYQGVEDTLRCIEGFAGIDWPRQDLQLVVVDNASGGGEAERIRVAHPEVTVVDAGGNLGFAGGCNLGVRKSTGDVIAFVNNDAKPDPGFVRESVRLLAANGDIGAVATKVLDWEGGRIDFVDAGMSWYGQAFKLHVGAQDTGEFDVERDVLFGTGSALVVRRTAFEIIGGFDESFFMFFEDVDLGWRMWLAGYRVRFVPAAVTYHRHHASMSAVGSWREHYLLERNALAMIYKNYDDENLAAFLPGALALTARRGVVRSGRDPHELDLAHGNAPGEPGETSVSKSLLASLYALDAFGADLPRLAEARAAVQALRRRPDREIVGLFRTPMQDNMSEAAFTGVHRGIAKVLGIESHLHRRLKILVATGDAVTARMAGPAIRAWHIAETLSHEHEVVLASTVACDVPDPRFKTKQVNAADIVGLEAWADVIVFQGYLMHEHPVLRSSGKILVVDIYDPFHLEQLEQARDLGEEKRRDVVASATGVLNEQLARGDFFMCASEKQRDFWLGQLSALGRVNPEVYDQDESLGSLISVVPFGVENSPPVKTAAGMRGVIDGIGDGDKIVLWGGGIYNWFDPLTLIRAIDVVRESMPEIRLVFMGVKHPNPAVPKMRMASTAEQLADSLGLTGKHVFFNHGWVPYRERQNFLLEANVGVSTHLDHVETAFSFRTRMLDYMWASLPIVCTTGDSLAELVDRHDLGATVAPGDVDALAQALLNVLGDPERSERHRRNIAVIAATYRWQQTLAPLVAFCRKPLRAADLRTRAVAGTVRVVEPRWGGLRGDAGLLLAYLRAGGPRLLLLKASQRLRRVLGMR